ncbi:hypothetical protein D9M73_299130 [compost metagenome]
MKGKLPNGLRQRYSWAVITGSLARKRPRHAKAHSREARDADVSDELASYPSHSSMQESRTC